MFNEDVEIFSIVAMTRIIDKAKDSPRNEDGTMDDYTAGYVNAMVDAFDTLRMTNDEYKGFVDEEERKACWDAIYGERSDNVDSQ